MVKYLTPEGLKKLKEELEYLKKVKRKEIAERLRKTAALGDLSENAAYQEAKEAQAFLEGRILELEKTISEAKVVKKIDKAKWVQIGSVVWLRGEDNKIQKFKLVGTAEADPLNGKISIQSPLGKVLLDKPEGSEVLVKTPIGKMKYKIIKIE
jgi:transcription elongation factor GreA